MLEELERRNYAASTTRAYLRAVDEYARYFNRPPDQLGPDHIRQYQAYLFRERKLQPNTVIQHLGGIRFFYIGTLKQSWSRPDALPEEGDSSSFHPQPRGS
jgi:integrase/recombinase XerD